MLIFSGIANVNQNVTSKILFISPSFHTYNIPTFFFYTPMKRLVLIMLVHNKLLIIIFIVHY